MRHRSAVLGHHRPGGLERTAPVVAASGTQEGLFDGIAGIPELQFPSVGIANGAPTGAGATDGIVLTWPDGRQGQNHEQALVQYSDDRGQAWSSSVVASDTSDRTFLPAIAISPNGRH